MSESVASGFDLRRYVTIPFADKGRTRDGVDCWGWVRLFYQDVFEIALPSYDSDYADTEEIEEIVNLIERVRPTWVSVSTPRFGDVVHLNVINEPMHVGVYLFDGYIAHARPSTGVCRATVRRGRWRNKVLGYYRHASRA
jgi:cell wall-associated NlpC family hydrolase